MNLMVNLIPQYNMVHKFFPGCIAQEKFAFLFNFRNRGFSEVHPFKALGKIIPPVIFQHLHIFIRLAGISVIKSVDHIFLAARFEGIEAGGNHFYQLPAVAVLFSQATLSWHSPQIQTKRMDYSARLWIRGKETD